MDAVQKANSGHPGTPMGLAPAVYVLWDKFIRHNPRNPDWPNRDHFVLSAGHASMLLYSILHILGYDITLDDIKQFRQLHGKCAGHPEHGLTPGVETTTGPLGQGAATSVGFAIAERWLAYYFNREGFDIIKYNIFAITSDGCMMEGVTSEAASLAGHLGLSNLIWLYDNNHITIEGKTSLSFSEDVAARFKAYSWFVQHVKDANDLTVLQDALNKAAKEKERPSLIIIDSHIAYGSPNKQDSASAHGEPLGEQEIRETKIKYGWDPDKKFHVPAEIAPYREKIVHKGRLLEEEWKKKFTAYARKYPDLAKTFQCIQHREIPEGWEKALPAFDPDPKGLASREANGKVLNVIAKQIHWLIGGSADLAPSTKTLLSGESSFEKGNHKGRNLHFGIREHAMAAIANGMALSKLRPYVSTFLVFSDYMRPSLRLSCMMRQPVIYIFTHDSIALGEDGPTHQPVEQIASLRAIPNIDVFRPADGNELSVLWKYIMEVKDHPAALILTRQRIPTIDRKRYAAAEGALKGAYILADCENPPDIILIGTGSEIKICLDAHELLKKEGIRSRIVSMPCWSLFELQDNDYKEKILPSNVRSRIVVEAGSTFGWERYAGRGKKSGIIGMHSFGASAPTDDLLKEFGLTAEQVIVMAKRFVMELDS